MFTDISRGNQPNLTPFIYPFIKVMGIHLYILMVIDIHG